ncbi:hypothetical protein FKW77_002865 [Venturia effusa]|uniref:Uncharacterized protein n=1 Tax=Venturia effusa TaxID=50376 RepID=A0A517L2V9_9PEZI|nr:hypothetical protein FKW77_002865 [Venturia effusa]
MTPIRVGIIGLSAAATGTNWAATAHLPYLLKSPHYAITALCNSSVEAAQKAVKAYALPETTKTYGSPEDLANDPEVDLVVANTRVDKHAQVLLASLKKGKDVFCEWPLDRNAAVTREMLDAAREGGGRVMVGLQGRQSPTLKNVKSLIDEGRIGKVLSSSVIGAAGNGGGEESTAVRYFVEREVGGNMFTIQFGHGGSLSRLTVSHPKTSHRRYTAIDLILYTLGELKQYSTILGNQRPETRIVDRSSNTIMETVVKNSPDQVLLQGTLTTGPILSVHVRGGRGFASKPKFLWRIYGEKGEIEVTASGTGLNVGYDDEQILLDDFEKGTLETVSVDTDEWDELPRQARNVARLYEAFRKGKGDGIATFDEAVERHKMLDGMYEAWDKGDQGRLA